ncbi:MAG TPA: hypothetical protein IGQ44_13195 [Geminocystis sp. M7585_C2015_104]|nr:hypothetical protein [Geminocystis sp. M7585_C2015_104]
MSDFLPNFSLVILPSRPHKLLTVGGRDVLLLETRKTLEEAGAHVVVFLRANYKPVSEWLREILSPFSNPSTNIVVGKIKSKNRYFWERKRDILEEIWLQMGNCAVRRDFLSKIMAIQLPEKFPEEELVYYYRIFRELESEIVYQERAIVYET